jgi:hypothetical protein
MLVPLGVAAFIAVTPALASAAGWSSAGTGVAAAAAASLGPPQTVNAVGASATTVKVSVTAGPEAPSATPSGYRVDRVTAPAVTGAGYITGTTGNCDAAAVGSGANSYRVFSWIGANSASPAWVSTTFTPTSGTVVTDTVGPVVTAACPTANNTVAYSTGSSGTWVTACASAISGTAVDSAGVAKIEVSLQQGTGNGTSTCWNQASKFDQTCPWYLLATGTTAWNLPVARTVVNAAGTYTANVKATDGLGNISITSYTFKTS